MPASADARVNLPQFTGNNDEFRRKTFDWMREIHQGRMPGDVGIIGNLSASSANIGTLSVSAAYVTSLSVENLVVHGTLSVSGAAVIVGSTTLLGTATIGSASGSGVLNINPTDGVNEGGQINLIGASLNSSVALDNFNGRFRVIVGATPVASFGTASAAVAPPLELQSTLTVSGATTLASTLTVSGAAVLLSTLTVSGALAALTNLNVAGKLSVSAASVTGPLSASTIFAAAAVQVGTTLTVSGATTLIDGLSVGGAAALAGTLSVSGAAVFLSTITVASTSNLSGNVNVGSEGAVASLFVNARDAVNNGGALTLRGAAANTDVVIDNNASLLRFLVPTGTVAAQISVSGGTVVQPWLFQQTLTVSGATRLNGVLGVTGSASFGTSVVVGSASGGGLVTINAQDGVASGGRLNLNGASANGQVFIDNNAGNMRFFWSATDQMEIRATEIVIAPQVRLNGGISVSGTVTLQTTLTVSGAAVFNSSVLISATCISRQVFKAWAAFSGVGVVTLRNSFNIASITDVGVGNYQVNTTTSLSGTGYAVLSFLENNSAVLMMPHHGSANVKTTSGYTLLCQVTPGGTATDSPVVFVGFLAS